MTSRLTETPAPPINPMKSPPKITTIQVIELKPKVRAAAHVSP